MKRLQFLVKDEVYNRLLELQQKTEANSLSEVFRDALRAYAWMLSEYGKGGNPFLATQAAPRIFDTAPRNAAGK